MEYIDIGNALKLENSIFVDVRSPLEYEEDKIMNAVNIPILDDEERVIIGTLYKHEGKDIAIEKGLEFTGGKLSDFYAKYKDLNIQYKNIIIYCARGGMRSESISKFISSLNIPVFKLNGGYKSYRNYVLEYFKNENNQFKFVVLHGHTGVGKTDVLKTLLENNINAIDLEGYAKNSGSVFGHVYFNEAPPSQKYFETMIFKYIFNLKQKYIFIESESKRIGAVCVPDFIYEKITLDSKRILITSNVEKRVERLVDQYVSNTYKDDEVLVNAIWKLNKKLGNEKIKYLVEKVNSNEYDVVAKEIMINYYDPLYQYSIDKYKYDLSFSSDDYNETIIQITRYYDMLNEGRI